MPTVADARKDFTDLLGRAHFTDEVIPIVRRNTPYARIVSEQAGQFIEKADEMAEKAGLDSRDELLNEFDTVKANREYMEELERVRISKGLGTREQLLGLLADMESQAE